MSFQSLHSFPFGEISPDSLEEWYTEALIRTRENSVSGRFASTVGDNFKGLTDVHHKRTRHIRDINPLPGLVESLQALHFRGRSLEKESPPARRVLMGANPLRRDVGISWLQVRIAY